MFSELPSDCVTEAVPTRDVLHHHLLPPLGPVRARVVDQLPHPPRHRTWPHGAPHHSLPRPRQHLQQRQHQLPEGK